MSSVIKRALISEKSFGKASENKYTFVVTKSARKEEISREASDLFNITVLSVNTTNYEGKVKRGKKCQGKRSDFKKAILTLKKGDKIGLFEFEKPEEDKKAKK